MKYVIVNRKGDSEASQKYVDLFLSKSDEELVSSYNQQAKLGFVGVHQQALYVRALHTSFMARFGISPVTIEDNIVVSMTGLIKIVGNTFVHIENQLSD